MNTAGLDLNLLRVFDAVYRERNATRAARRVGLSQPAVSNALSRLRAQLGDELFHRAPEGLRPTARADALAEPVRAALGLIEDALEGPEFLPALTRRTFRVASVDYAVAVLMPRVAARLAREAPNSRLVVLPSIGRTLDLLDDGEIDVGLLIRSAPPERFEAEPILRDEYVVVMRPTHPLAEAEMTLAAYAEWPHLLMSPTAEVRGVVDERLAKQGLTRRVAMVVTQFPSAPPILEATDMIHTCPRRIADIYAKRFGLAIRPTPFDTHRGAGPVSMIWRRRLGESAATSWFRKILLEEAATVLES
ncbi:MAG: LysR family transcriptional regulator [Pseudomonadota bacterium]